MEKHLVISFYSYTFTAEKPLSAIRNKRYVDVRRVYLYRCDLIC